MAENFTSDILSEKLFFDSLIDVSIHANPEISSTKDFFNFLDTLEEKGF